MTTIARLVVGLDADTTNLETGLARGTRQIAGFGRSLLGLAGVGTVTTALTLATRSAAEFGHQMAEIATLLPDTSQLDALKESVRALSNEFGKSSAEEARALYEIISAGAADAATATQILTTANQLAVGGVTSVAVAADGLTSVLAAYSSAGLTATEVADSFFIAAAGGKTTIEELSTSIGQVAPLAAQMGASLDEVTSAISALTKGGVSTRIAVTGLRAILASVAKPSDEASKEARRLGLAFNSAALSSKGLAGFLETVKTATSGNVDSLSRLFGGVEALVPVLALTGNSAKDFAATLGLMETKAGATSTALEKIETLSPQIKFDRLKSVVSNAAIEIGDKILNVLVPAAQAATTNIGEIGAAITALAKAIAVTAIITTLASLSKALRALIALETVATVISLARGVKGLADALVFARLALTLFVRAIPVWGLIATGVAVLATAIFKAGEETRKAKADTENYSRAIAGLNRNQLEAAKSGVQLALAQSQGRLSALASGGFIDTARNVFAIQRERDAIRALGRELTAIEKIRPVAPLADSLPGVTVTGSKDAASRLVASEAAAGALASFMARLQTGVQNLKTNFGAVANEQVVLTGLGEEYLTLTQQITSALAQQRDALGSTATTLRGMLLDLRNVFSPDLSELTKKIEESFRNAIANSGAAKIMAAVLTPASLGSPLAIRNGVEAATNATIRSFSQLRGALATFANALRTIGNTAKDSFRQQFAQFGAGARSPQEAAALFVILPVINGLFETLGPTLEALQEPLRVLGTILGSALVPILRILFPVFKGVAIAATYIGEVFFKVSAVFNRAVGSLVRGLGNLINKLPGSLGDPLVKAGQALLNLADAYTEGAAELAKGREELRKLEFGGAAEALNKTAEAANALTDSLLNVPSGFKIAAAVFAATLPVLTGAASIPSAPISSIPFNIPAPSFPSRPPSIPAGGGGGGGMIIEAGAIVINGVNKSQREVAKEVISALRQEGYEQFGDSSRWPETV